MTAAPAPPRLLGWFQYPVRPALGPDAGRALGVISCCWRRPGSDEAAPAGWLVLDQPGESRLSQWVWLGAPGDGATAEDLARAWAASGAWDPEPDDPESWIHYVHVTGGAGDAAPPAFDRRW